MSAAGALRSTGITPRPHYYSPVRHPLVSPPISRGLRLYDGSSSRAFRPGTRRASPVARCVLCLRAAGSTPPMEPDASASVRQSLLPSPPTVGLGPRHLRFSRHPRRSLALRPGHSLAIPWMTWSIGFSSVGFPSGCYPSYGALALTPVGLTPTEHTCLIWTHPSAPAPGVPRRTTWICVSPAQSSGPASAAIRIEKAPASYSTVSAPDPLRVPSSVPSRTAENASRSSINRIGSATGVLCAGRRRVRSGTSPATETRENPALLGVDSARNHLPRRYCA